MAAAVVALARSRNLFAVVVLSGVYSFMMATVLVALDAVDVAMTEASVGAGISTVLFLATLHLVKSTEMKQIRVKLLPLFVVAVTGGVLVWGTLVLPPFGTADAPIHKHVAPRYLSESIKETNVPNVVTSILADYRSFDTLGETTVIFTAGIGVLLLLRRSRRREADQDAEPPQ